MNDTFMKERPVFPLILSMAMPMVISMLVNSLYNIVDSFFVAQISENAMTALSLVFPVQNFQMQSQLDSVSVSARRLQSVWVPAIKKPQAKPLHMVWRCPPYMESC